jgi:hypothetical protein
MPSAPKKTDVSKFLPAMEGLEVEKLEYKRPEDEQEKALRLHKERVGFYVKEVVTPGFAAALVIVAVICCLVFLFGPQSSAAEKQWAGTVLMSVLTGALGYAFGRTSK